MYQYKGFRIMITNEGYMIYSPTGKFLRIVANEKEAEEFIDSIED